MSARISWLDVKLALRMLVKHPGLTLVGGLGLAVGVAISAAFFSVTAALEYPVLPLDEGDRIVALENRDAAVNDEERRSLHDFVAWRGELRSVRDLGAFRWVDRNLVTGEGPPEPVKVAEMTAAGFRVARVPPLLGRWLVEEERARGGTPGGGDRPRRVAGPLRGRSRRRRAGGAPGGRRAHGGGGDAGGLRLPHEPELVDPAAG
jgi:hypothetical protein